VRRRSRTQSALLATTSILLVVAGILAASTGARPVASTAAASPPFEYGCPIFPANNALNRDISGAAVDPRSATYLANIGLSGHLHPDFGTPQSYGIPFSVVGQGQPKVPISFRYRSESEPGPYPVPANAPVEGAGDGGDRHVLVLQRGSCKLYELFAASRAGGGWAAGSGAVFNLRSNALRREGWTSADAAGLPIMPLLVRYPEVRAGRIAHALRLTVIHTQRGFIHPANHFASESSDPNLPPMGLRLRLKAGFSLSGFHGESLIVLRALKRYGLIVADNGPSWHVTGAPDPRWNDGDIEQLKRVPGSAFEVVQSGPIRHNR
jgi:hypothetical protein